MSKAAEHLSVFVAGIHLASELIHGCASGSYSNLACLSPRGAVRWYRSILSEPEKALEQEAEIRSVFEKALAPVRGKYSNSALDKALASAGAWADLSPRVRWPLKSIPSIEVDKIAQEFRQKLPFLFAEERS